MKKRYTPKERAAMFKPTYFFGYGSLIAPDGINYRGMRKRYKTEDLHPCVLKGFKRSMCGFFEPRNFYGLLKDKKSYCNGVIFEVHSWNDYRRLLGSEGATSIYRKERTYWPIDVTYLISGWKVPKRHRVIALVCKQNKSNLGKIERSYVHRCYKAADIWGKDFRNEFLKTGGVAPKFFK
ncbi:MAG: gamma-glutamylcyclotransferase [Candidatus Stahlbacteria bacterium]|nr:MAG: gamma-glutamylcyclotransferase [Candidatus Stahlbacteria bacterium]